MRRHAIEPDSVELTPEFLAAQDCVLVETDHAAIVWAAVARHARLVVDSRNVAGGGCDTGARVVPS